MSLAISILFTIYGMYFTKKLNKKLLFILIIFMMLIFSNCSFAKYMLTKDFSIDISSFPFYFETSAENATIEFVNDKAVLNLNIKNNDERKYNNFDTKYEISIIDNDVFDISIDNTNYASVIESTLLGNSLKDENINVFFKVKNGSTKQLIENLNLKIVTKSPYIKEFILPVRIITYQEWCFDYTGDVQTFTAPIAGKYKLETWGAQGGSYNTTYYGGKGGYSTGNITLTQNKELYVYVGGKGNSTGEHIYQAGGYNGGGSATPDSDANTRQSSGGGATHIAYKLGLLSELVNSKNEILIVAGGGGGSAANSAVMAVYAGAGGGLTGNSGGDYYETEAIYGTGYGGTQTAGGGYNCPSAHLRASGSFGQGGNGLYAGGGGGYYGGGVGHCSAGGGSSYIAGVDAGLTIDGKNSMPTHDGSSTMAGNVGNGYAKITFLGE